MASVGKRPKANPGKAAVARAGQINKLKKQKITTGKAKPKTAIKDNAKKKPVKTKMK